MISKRSRRQALLASALAVSLQGCATLAGDTPKAALEIRPAKSTIAATRPNDGLYQSAVAAIDRRDYALALDMLQAARDRDPGDARVLNAFGVVYDKLGRFDLSHRYYARAQVADPGSTIVAANLAYSQVLQGGAPIQAPAALASAAVASPVVKPTEVASAVTTARVSTATVRPDASDPVPPHSAPNARPPARTVAVAAPAPANAIRAAVPASPAPPAKRAEAVSMMARLARFFAPAPKHVKDPAAPRPMAMASVSPRQAPADTAGVPTGATLSAVASAPAAAHRAPSEAPLAADAAMSTAPSAPVARPVLYAAAPHRQPPAQARISVAAIVAKPRPAAPANHGPAALQPAKSARAEPWKPAPRAALVPVKAAKVKPAASGKIVLMGRPVTLLYRTSDRRSADQLRAQLASRGWTLTQAATRQGGTATTVRYEPSHRKIAAALARSLRMPVKLEPCAGRCSGVTLILGGSSQPTPMRKAMVASGRRLG